MKRLLDIWLGAEIWIRRLMMVALCLLSLSMLVMVVFYLLHWLFHGHPPLNCQAGT